MSGGTPCGDPRCGAERAELEGDLGRLLGECVAARRAAASRLWRAAARGFGAAAAVLAFALLRVGLGTPAVLGAAFGALAVAALRRAPRDDAPA